MCRIKETDMIRNAAGMHVIHNFPKEGTACPICNGHNLTVEHGKFQVCWGMHAWRGREKYQAEADEANAAIERLEKRVNLNG